MFYGRFVLLTWTNLEVRKNPGAWHSYTSIPGFAYFTPLTVYQLRDLEVSDLWCNWSLTRPLTWSWRHTVHFFLGSSVLAFTLFSTMSRCYSTRDGCCFLASTGRRKVPSWSDPMVRADLVSMDIFCVCRQTISTGMVFSSIPTVSVRFGLSFGYTAFCSVDSAYKIGWFLWSYKTDPS